MADYKLIRSELEHYNPILLQKVEYVFLTKTDMVSLADLKLKLASLKKAKIKAIPISVLDDESMEAVKKVLNSLKVQK